MVVSFEPLVLIIGNTIKNRYVSYSTLNRQEYLQSTRLLREKGKIKIISEMFSLDNIAEVYEKISSENVCFLL